MSTQNVNLNAPVLLMPFVVSGQRTASVTAVARYKLPFAVRLLGVSVSARASGGTTPTLTVDVLDDGVSVLAAPVDVTAGAVSEGVVSSPAIADESIITLNLAIGGTTPTWNDISGVMTLVRV